MSIGDRIEKALSEAGFRSAVVPFHRSVELVHDIRGLRDDGILDPGFSKNWLEGFTDESLNVLPSARSIIIAAARQPKTIVRFTVSGKPFPVVIPPTYTHETDALALEVMTPMLETEGFRVVPATVPKKRLAVRVGLAEYGRNNIAYIDGWGSFFRLSTFFSDMPVEEAAWHDVRLMDVCEQCRACSKACPTQAIPDPGERFIIRAERCLTNFNERAPDFPGWIDPSSHNSLIGCMICQEICPANRDVKDWERDGAEFSDEETALILRGASADDLPEATAEKLKGIYMWEDYRVLRRNLQSLIAKNHSD